MNCKILKSMDTGRVSVHQLTALLKTLGLKHSSKTLPDLLKTADECGTSCPCVLETEVKGSNERRWERNLAGAHFPLNNQASR